MAVEFSQAVFDTICERIADGESLRSICRDNDMPSTGPAIYALCDPETGEPRYIGKANNPEKRMASHERDAARRDYPVYRWMLKLRKRGLSPDMVVIWRGEDWKTAERKMIEVSRARGWRLLNVAAGGDEPYCPQEVRSRNGHALCERLRSNPDMQVLRHKKARLVCAARDGYMSEETMWKVVKLGLMYPKEMGAWARKVESIWRAKSTGPLT